MQPKSFITTAVISLEGQHNCRQLWRNADEEEEQEKKQWLEQKQGLGYCENHVLGSGGGDHIWFAGVDPNAADEAQSALVPACTLQLGILISQI